MKKSLSLLMAILMVVTVVGVAPTVFAEEAEFTIVDEVFGKTYWKDFYKKYDQLRIVKAGDWYYAFRKNMFMDEELLVVCGYDGNATEITIPTVFDDKSVQHISEFYIFSKSVKTVNIPKEIISINGIEENREWLMEDEYSQLKKVVPVIRSGNSQLETIVVDGENPKYKSLDGVLFTKNCKKLIYYPTHKLDKKYVVPSTVSRILEGAFLEALNLKTLTITPTVAELDKDCIPKEGLEELYFENMRIKKTWDTAEDGSIEGNYIPDVPNTVVYCIKDSELYKYYKASFEEPDGMCKELKALPQLTETLIKESDGKWYYYCNDYKMYDSTLVKYKGKWFYVTNGVWDKTVTDKVITYKNKSFYIKNGKWDSSVNTLTKKNGEWLGIVNGKCDNSANTLIKYKGKWFYVKNGEWCKKTAIVKYKGKRFYVKNGKVDFDFSGKKKIDGKTYKIKNGKVA